MRVFQGSQQRTSAFHVIGDLLDDAKIADVEAIVDEEIARLLKEGISDAELKRAVTRRESDYVWQLEGLHERAEVLQAYNHYLGDPGRIGWDLERYRKLTPADVKAAAASYLASDRRGEIVTMPATGAQQDPSVLAPQPASTPAPESDPPEPGLTFAEEPFRATRPAAATARALEPPKVERFTMGDGIEVYLVERHQLPVVAMDLVVDGGRVSEPKGKEGLADLAANLLDDGTQKLGKVAFEEAQGDLGSTIGASADDEEMSLRLATLKKNLEPTLDLFADTVLSPGLRAEDHERNVKQAIAALRQSKGSPAALSRRLVPAMLHGPTHALGRIRTEASLESVTLDDVRSFVSSSWKPHGARLFVMGDVTRGEIEKLAGKRLASFKGTAAAIPKLAPFEPMAPRIVFVDVPGASQSVIVLGEPGPPRQASDHVATRLAMNVLGGDFTSRINMNLREDKGWAYGAYAGIAYSKTLGTFQASASVKTDATRDAVLELLKEVKGVASGDVKEEEVTREKDAAILGLPGRFATGSEIIATFRGLAFFGLPLDYYATFAGKVKATTRDDAGKAARAHLDPGALRLLVVGDGARVLPGLKELAATQALGPGELALLDADGAPVEP
ncbi:MAG: insulinase family protein [Acidobacteriota bacterium]